MSGASLWQGLGHVRGYPWTGPWTCPGASLGHVHGPFRGHPRTCPRPLPRPSADMSTAVRGPFRGHVHGLPRPSADMSTAVRGKGSERATWWNFHYLIFCFISDVMLSVTTCFIFHWIYYRLLQQKFCARWRRMRFRTRSSADCRRRSKCDFAIENSVEVLTVSTFSAATFLSSLQNHFTISNLFWNV